MQLPEGVTQQDIELQSDCMAEKVTIRLRKEVGGKQLDRRYFQEHPIRQNISLAESEVKEEQDAVLFTVVLNQPQEASVHLQRETAGTEAEITLQSPASLYDKIVVLDAGHGGNDVGETVVEQDVSLQERILRWRLYKRRENCFWHRESGFIIREKMIAAAVRKNGLASPMRCRRIC